MRRIRKGHVRAVFLDAGGTLIHTRPSAGAVYAEHARALGADVAAAQIEDTLWAAWHDFQERARSQAIPPPISDQGDVDMWREVTGRVHATVPEMAGVPFDDWFERIYGAFSRGEHWAPFPDAVALATELRRLGVVVGVVSNWSSRLPVILQETGLLPHVDFSVVSAIAGARKPDPRIFAEALERAGVGPGEAIHVGDTPADDLHGPAAAGVQGVLIDRDDRHPSLAPRVATLLDILDWVR